MRDGGSSERGALFFVFLLSVPLSGDLPPFQFRPLCDPCKVFHAFGQSLPYLVSTCGSKIISIHKYCRRVQLPGLSHLLPERAIGVPVRSLEDSGAPFTHVYPWLRPFEPSTPHLRLKWQVTGNPTNLPPNVRRIRAKAGWTNVKA